MKKEIYNCDICLKECGSPRKGEGKIQVIFITEQNEGRPIAPYLEFVNVDLCEMCRERILMGDAVWAEGAMGYNKYFFKAMNKLIK